MNNKVKTNNGKAWNSLYSGDYHSGGTFLPSWGLHSSGSDLTPKLLTITGKSVLEIGCGIGESVPFVAKKNPKEYVGIDISQNGINEAKRKYGNKEISFQTADMSKDFAFPENTFDEVFSVYGIGWSENIEKTLSEIFKVLKPGGTFTFSWDHYLVRVVDEQEGRVVFQSSYNQEKPTVRFNWNQTGYNIQSFQAKPSTWFELLRKTGFEVTAFHEITTNSDKEKKHVFSSTYSKNKSKMIPFTLVMQAKKPVK
jgi:ubiquinone/menaquinone biosynthesis C-methylase UbiE